MVVTSGTTKARNRETSGDGGQLGAKAGDGEGIAKEGVVVSQST